MATTAPYSQVDPLPPGQPDQIGPYRLLGLLGYGGLGWVFLARHEILGMDGETVAIKVLQPTRRLQTECVERFRREILALGHLVHPGIVRVITAGVEGNQLYLVMERLHGRSLHQLRGPLEVADVCAVISQVAQALAYLHRNGFIHRDIKASNLLLTYEGHVKILDLGLVKILGELSTGFAPTRPSQMMGSGDYLAPEQARDASRADERADVYGLGVTFYRLLEDRLPYPATSLMGQVEAHLTRPLPPLTRADVPPPVWDLLQRMRKRPEGRPLPAEVVSTLAPYCAGAQPTRLLQAAQQDEADPTASQVVPPPTPRRFIPYRLSSCQLSPQMGALLGLLAVLVALMALCCSGQQPADDGLASAPGSERGSDLLNLDGQGQTEVDLLAREPKLADWSGPKHAFWKYEPTQRLLRVQEPERAVFLLGKTQRRGYTLILTVRQTVPNPGVLVLLGGPESGAGVARWFGSAPSAEAPGKLAAVQGEGRLGEATLSQPLRRFEIASVHLSRPIDRLPRVWSLEALVQGGQLARVTVGQPVNSLLNPTLRQEAIPNVPPGILGVAIHNASAEIVEARWRAHAP